MKVEIHTPLIQRLPIDPHAESLHFPAYHRLLLWGQEAGTRLGLTAICPVQEKIHPVLRLLAGHIVADKQIQKFAGPLPQMEKGGILAGSQKGQEPANVTGGSRDCKVAG